MISAPFYLNLFTGLLGYVEMHYRFPFFPFSRYFKKEPEILADAPHRVDPGKSIPVSVVIKDSDSYPVHLLSVELQVKYPSGKIDLLRNDYDKPIIRRWFWDNILIEPQESGTVEITANIHFKINGKPRTVRNHNISTSPDRPLIVEVDTINLPGSQWYEWGDLHYHSNYTEDFVEFGAPLANSAAAAEALGLQFLAITDHSYDLDDKVGSWTETDPKLLKWQQLQNAIKRHNQAGPVLLIPGEEVTVRNSIGNNVHCLILNNPDFIPGSGDSAESWYRTNSEYSIKELMSLTGPETARIASHPFAVYSRLEKILLNRGKWESSDLELPGLDGMQILNGKKDDGYVDGLEQWIKLLLGGTRSRIYAGNDAHGNFNYFHQIDLPMARTIQRDTQILGNCRTGLVKRSDHRDVSGIISGLKSGQCIITDGPAIKMEIFSDKHHADLGDTWTERHATIRVSADSTPRFGSIEEIKIYLGYLGDSEERSVMTVSGGPSSYTVQDVEQFVDVSRPGYIRGKILTSSGNIARTNPIWLDPK